MATTVEQKRALRRTLRQRLSAMTTEERKSASARIRAHLAALLPQVPQSVASFAGLSDEPDLMPLSFEPPPGTQHLAWHFPLVSGDDIQLFRVHSPHDLNTGAFQIREPDPQRCEPVAIADINLILVPGFGFDPETGHRIGRGKGFYDRFLASARSDVRLIGIGFDCQLTKVPTEPHDVPLHAVMTESGLLTFR